MAIKCELHRSHILGMVMEGENELMGYRIPQLYLGVIRTRSDQAAVRRILHTGNGIAVALQYTPGRAFRITPQSHRCVCRAGDKRFSIR